MIAFLRIRHNAELILDPSEPGIDLDQFKKEDWSTTPYGDGEEAIPTNKPETRGLGFIVIAYCDVDHAYFFVYLNKWPVYWISKKQASIEISSYGSEFTALKHCCEYLRGLRYKLRKIGIPFEFPSFIKGYNKSFLVNSTVPHSTSKKKSCSISFHNIREGVANDMPWVQ